MTFFNFIVLPDLSAYVAEELKLLQEELASVDKVTVKLELEMSQAIKIKGQCCLNNFSLSMSSLWLVLFSVWTT